MSIENAIKALEETELFAVLSSWEGEETPRHSYISLEVAGFLWEPADDDKWLAKIAKAVFDDFVEGGHIPVGWDPHKKDGSCLMARVDSHVEGYEIWDVRCLAPKPGMRVLGGFAEKDVFVGITWDYRKNFDDHWPEQIERCVSEWKRLFGNCLPFRGKTADEYLSKPFEVV